MSDDFRSRVLKRDGHSCRNCGSNEDLHVHHIVPISNGGNDIESNCVVLCSSCHGRTHDKRLENTREGVKRAREDGKWFGQVPTGFVSVEGYLRPNLTPDYDDGETGYQDMVAALEAIEDGESYRSVARETPNVTRQALMAIHKGERKSWYLGEPSDERVAEALAEVDGE